MHSKRALNVLNVMTTKDVAEKLGVTIRAVQIWVDQGIFDCWKTPGGHRRITKESFNCFVSTQGIVVAPSQNINAQLKAVAIEDNVAKQMRQFEPLP